jgi:hypothetical protein
MHVIRSLGLVAVLLFTACSTDSGEGGGSRDAALEDATGSGGAGEDAARGSGGAKSGGATGSGGHADRGGQAGSGGSAASQDAAIDQEAVDAAPEAAPPPQCLGATETCGEGDAGTCCEAYVCRLGKCCVPTGIWSNCLSGADCCSGSCIQRQCTCVPLGYSCNGPGSCCGGYACVNGTCICPPDIRGCNTGGPPPS